MNYVKLTKCLMCYTSIDDDVSLPYRCPACHAVHSHNQHMIHEDGLYPVAILILTAKVQPQFVSPQLVSKEVD